MQDAVVERAVSVELGFPLMGRAEHFQGRVGGHQFHGGGRVHGHVGVVNGWNPGAAEGQQHQGQGVVAQLVGFKRLLNFWCEGGIDGGGVGAESQWQKKAGEKQRP